MQKCHDNATTITVQQLLIHWPITDYSRFDVVEFR